MLLYSVLFYNISGRYCNMKYQIICTETKLSPVVQKNIIDKLEKVEKMLYTSEEFDCRIVVKFRNNKSKVEITIPTPAAMHSAVISATIR